MKCPEGYRLMSDDDGEDNGVYVPDEHPRYTKDDRRYYCLCGGSKFEVFSPEPYDTKVRCVDCERETTVHSG